MDPAGREGGCPGFISERERDPCLGVHLHDGRRCAARVPGTWNALHGRVRGYAYLNAVPGRGLGEDREEMLGRRTQVGAIGRASDDALADGCELLWWKLSQACGHTHDRMRGQSDRVTAPVRRARCDPGERLRYGVTTRHRGPDARAIP